MENTQKEKEVIQIVLKTLDQLKFKYDKRKERLDYLVASYTENRKMYDGKTINSYSVAFFMEYNPSFGETQCFYATVVDSPSLKVLFITIAHGYLEIIYDKDGKATKTKFISPSIPYDKQ
jgi:hypothetical protein